MEGNNFDNYNDQFVVSHELIKLMQWIVKYNQDGLHKIVEDTLARERNNRLKSNEIYTDVSSEEELQNSILDFFGIMEMFLYESQNKTLEQEVLQKSMLPALKHVDKSFCDPVTVNSCAAIATTKTSKYNPKELFFKELLKRWKPAKQNLRN